MSTTPQGAPSFQLRRRTVRLGLWILSWTLLGLFFSTQSYLYDTAAGESYGFLTAVLWTMPVWYSFGLLTPFIIWFDRRLDPDLELKRRIARHFPFAIAWTLVYMAIRTTGQRLLVGPWVSLSFASIATQFHYGFLNYFLFGGVYNAYRYYREGREQELHASRLEAQLSQARVRALRDQLQPHFLFNSLNAVSALVERDGAKARRMLDDISTLLRSLLDRADRQLSPLADELALLDHYVAIQQTRFGDRLTVTMQIEPETRRALVPTFLLQPIVENAVRHGIARAEGTGVLRIAAWRENGRVVVEVADNGPGVQELADLSEGTGLGLSITEERLEMLYGADHGLTVENAAEGGAVVRITLPFRAPPNDE